MKNNKERISWEPGTMIYPLPAVLVTCGAQKEEYNVLTISWVGTICSSPAMCYISVRPTRYSHDIIKKNGEFVINLTTVSMARETDWCGVKSGRNCDKIGQMKFSLGKGECVNAPIIMESPVNIECKVKQIIPLGSHDMFIAEVVNVQVDPQFLDEKTNEFKLEEANLLAYTHGHYYGLGKEIGRFGWSVKKKRV